jgi:hypothetical protein
MSATLQLGHNLDEAFFHGFLYVIATASGMDPAHSVSHDLRKHPFRFRDHRGCPLEVAGLE